MTNPDEHPLVEVVAIELYRHEMDYGRVVSLEAATRALTSADAKGDHHGDCTKESMTCMRCERERMLVQARAALAAIEAAGWRVVPAHPTEAQIDAHQKAMANYIVGLSQVSRDMNKRRLGGLKVAPKVKAAIRYKAMIEAAPKVTK
jgi:hypothetical protein